MKEFTHVYIFITSREKDFEEPDYRYKGRDTFKDSQKSDSRDKDKGTKSSSWAREYDDRLSVSNICIHISFAVINGSEMKAIS